MSTSPSERRSGPRQNVDHAVRLTVGERTLSGRLTSLSRMGALVVVDRPYSIGTPLAFELELPEGKGVVELLGQVVRVEPSEASSAIGILFAPLTPATVVLIDSFIASQP